MCQRVPQQPGMEHNKGLFIWGQTRSKGGHPQSSLCTGNWNWTSKKGLRALMVHETTPKVGWYLKGLPTTNLIKYFSSSTDTCFFLSWDRLPPWALAGLEHTMLEQADFKLRSACLHLPNAGLKGMWLPCLASDTFFFFNSSIYACVQTGQKICS